jgi:hypothetical protein
MSDFDAAPASGARKRATGPASGGSPPPVLVAALGAALVIAVGLVALFSSGGGGGGDDFQPVPLDGAAATAPAARKRVQLTVSVDGDGSGRVRIASGVACSQSCERGFAFGKRLIVTADAADGSSFERWGDACSGTAHCSFVMDGDRSLTATFKSTSDVAQQCDADVDPSCSTATPTEPPAPAGDCQDGRDNDGDGLVDAAQDPDCEHGSESGSTASPTPATPPKTPAAPPPSATANQCADGRDNDGDGLVDRAQDPDCRTGRSEGAARAQSECQDGRDNDGDGLVDSAQDPGCADGRTEAG